MNAAKPAEATTSSDSKVKLLDRIKQSPKTAKTTKVLAGVGVAAIAVVGYASLKNKKSVKVSATLPDLDVTTTDS